MKSQRPVYVLFCPFHHSVQLSRRFQSPLCILRVRNRIANLYRRGQTKNERTERWHMRSAQISLTVYHGVVYTVQ